MKDMEKDAYTAGRAGSGRSVILDKVTFEDELLQKAYDDYLKARSTLKETGPVTLDDLAAAATRLLRKQGRLSDLAAADGEGRFAVRINVSNGDEDEPWLLTMCGLERARDDAAGKTPDSEADDAAACLAGCVNEAMSGRARVLSAIRLCGAADPLLAGREGLVADAQGCSEYSRRAGICVSADDIYHEAYAGSRMELCAALAAAPSVNVRNEQAAEGDAVLLLGGRGEEHRLQRLMTDADAARMIKKCEALTGCREGLLATMDAADAGRFADLAAAYDVSCSETEEMTDEQGSGAALHVEAAPAAPGGWQAAGLYGRQAAADAPLDFASLSAAAASGLNICSRRGLTERFDTTAGSGTVLMPYGGRNRLTQAQASVHRIPLAKGATDDCVLLSYGADPYISAASPYHGAYLAVVDSVAKLAASGADPENVHLYFSGGSTAGADRAEAVAAACEEELAALLGAFRAQMGLGAAAVGRARFTGTGNAGAAHPFISLAFAMGRMQDVISPEFKGAGHRAVLLSPYPDDDKGAGAGLPSADSLLSLWTRTSGLVRSCRVLAASACGEGGPAAAVMKMALGNGIGFDYMDPQAGGPELEELFGIASGSIILEMAGYEELEADGFRAVTLGFTTDRQVISRAGEEVHIGELAVLCEGALESVYPANVPGRPGTPDSIGYRARSWHAPLFKRSAPRVIIPSFAGCVGTADIVRAAEQAGARADIFTISSRDDEALSRSAESFAAAAKESQIIFIPDAFPLRGDTEALADTMAEFFRLEGVRKAVTYMLDRKDGLIFGTGTGFSALLKLGLLPSGRITDAGKAASGLSLEADPAGIHRSAIVGVRVASNKSPWLRSCEPGTLLYAPFSHSMGGVRAPEELLRKLAACGQIATQYAGPDGSASADTRYDPCGSMQAVESISSPDGRVLGCMTHPERVGNGLYINTGKGRPGLFNNAVRYFR